MTEAEVIEGSENATASWQFREEGLDGYSVRTVSVRRYDRVVDGHVGSVRREYGRKAER